MMTLEEFDAITKFYWEGTLYQENNKQICQAVKEVCLFGKTEKGVSKLDFLHVSDWVEIFHDELNSESFKEWSKNDTRSV